jgi:hypothetical protein
MALGIVLHSCSPCRVGCSIEAGSYTHVPYDFGDLLTL